MKTLVYTCDTCIPGGPTDLTKFLKPRPVDKEVLEEAGIYLKTTEDRPPVVYGVAFDDEILDWEYSADLDEDRCRICLAKESLMKKNLGDPAQLGATNELWAEGLGTALVAKDIIENPSDGDNVELAKEILERYQKT